MVDLFSHDGTPLLMIEIRDDKQPLGWNWGEGTPGLLPGLSFMPATMIGQALNTYLAVELVNDDDMILSKGIIDLMNKRSRQGKKTMWALDRDDTGQLRMSVYFPSMEALNAFKNKAKKLPDWDDSMCSNRMRYFP